MRFCTGNKIYFFLLISTTTSSYSMFSCLGCSDKKDEQEVVNKQQPSIQKLKPSKSLDDLHKALSVEESPKIASKTSNFLDKFNFVNLSQQLKILNQDFNTLNQQFDADVKKIDKDRALQKILADALQKEFKDTQHRQKLFSIIHDAAAKKLVADTGAQADLSKNPSVENVLQRSMSAIFKLPAYQDDIRDLCADITRYYQDLTTIVKIIKTANMAVSKPHRRKISHESFLAQVEPETHDNIMETLMAGIKLLQEKNFADIQKALSEEQVSNKLIELIPAQDIRAEFSNFIQKGAACLDNYHTNLSGTNDPFEALKKINILECNLVISFFEQYAQELKLLNDFVQNYSK